MTPEWTEKLKDPEFVRELKDGLHRFKLDCTYLDQNSEELTEKYPDQTVLAYRQEVVGHGETMEQAMEMAKEKGVRPGKCAWKVMYINPPTWILTTGAVEEGPGPVQQVTLAEAIARPGIRETMQIYCPGTRTP